MISELAVSQPRARAPVLRRALVAVVAAGIGLLAFASSCSEVDVVDQVTIVNRTPFDVEVQLSDSQKEGWLPLGRVGHEGSTVKEQVTDVGSTWVFQFHFGRRTVGEVTIARDELSSAGWRVEVPSAVADRMRELGFEPPPDR